MGSHKGNQAHWGSGRINESLWNVPIGQDVEKFCQQKCDENGVQC